ncbi:hypothetical protein AAKU55_004799 [Oxalobacteraceae bacterium GrIS 1.11]
MRRHALAVYFSSLPWPAYCGHSLGIAASVRLDRLVTVLRPVPGRGGLLAACVAGAAVLP